MHCTVLLCICDRSCSPLVVIKSLIYFLSILLWKFSTGCAHEHAVLALSLSSKCTGSLSHVSSQLSINFICNATHHKSYGSGLTYITAVRNYSVYMLDDIISIFYWPIYDILCALRPLMKPLNSKSVSGNVFSPVSDTYSL